MAGSENQQSHLYVELPEELQQDFEDKVVKLARKYQNRSIKKSIIIRFLIRLFLLDEDLTKKIEEELLNHINKSNEKS